MDISDEIRHQVAEKLGDKIRILEYDAPFVARIEARFPFEGSKIDWDRVPGALVCGRERRGSNRSSLEAAQEFLAGHESTELLYFVGDGLMDGVITSELECFLEVLTALLEWPQHIYVIPENADWCLAFYTEGWAGMGFATK